MHLAVGKFSTKFFGIDFQTFYCVAHKIPGRLRLRPCDGTNGVTGAELAEFIDSLPECTLVEVSANTGSVLITICGDTRSVKEVVDESVPNPIPAKVVSYAFPLVVRSVLAVFKSIPICYAVWPR